MKIPVCIALRQKAGVVRYSKLSKDYTLSLLPFIFKFSVYSLYFSESLSIADEGMKSLILN